MNWVSDRGTSGYIEIDHPWISNDEMLLHRWTFPEEANGEELDACLGAPEDWGARAHYQVAWVIDRSNKLFSEPLEAEDWAKVQLAAKLAELQTEVAI